MVTVTGPVLPTSSDAVRPALFGASERAAGRQPVGAVPGRDDRDRPEAGREQVDDAAKKAAAEKVAYLRNKLLALQLSAGSSATTGDLKAARTGSVDVQALTKELAQALRDAGLVPSGVGPEAARPAPLAKADRETEKTGAREKRSEPDPAAEGLVKDLRKVVAQLRLTMIAAQIRGAAPEQMTSTEKQLRETEKELLVLDAALAAKSSGPPLDLRA
jgi:hypothetical protein